MTKPTDIPNVDFASLEARLVAALDEPKPKAVLLAMEDPSLRDAMRQVLLDRTVRGSRLDVREILMPDRSGSVSPEDLKNFLSQAKVDPAPSLYHRRPSSPRGGKRRKKNRRVEHRKKR